MDDPLDDAMAEQEAVYSAYRELMRLAAEEGLGGRLLLVTPGADAGPGGDALVRAASIAGAATLQVEPDGERARGLVRAGVCDFLVNTLSEALRILKNEVRQHRVVAVCVLGEPQAVLAECIERGVQPDLLAVHEEALVERGARVVPGRATLPGAAMVQWTAPASSSKALAKLDRLALETADGDLVLKTRWLACAMQYLPRSKQSLHSVGMTEVERERFLAGIACVRERGELPAEVHVRWRGSEGIADLKGRGV